MERECLLSPERGKNEPEIFGTTILCPNPAELHRLERLTKKYTVRQLFMYNARLWQVKADGEEFCICGPAVGAPMAVLALEKLIALGSRRIIVLGTCGALAKSLAIGDIILPVSSVSEEGTSGHYPLSEEPFASATLGERLRSALEHRDIPTTSGKIWTTDAPYRETRKKIMAYTAAGMLAVDMEFSALVTVARFRKIQLAAVMVVSDIVCGDQWLSGFSSKIFKKQCQTVCEVVLEQCLGGKL